MISSSITIAGVPVSNLNMGFAFRGTSYQECHRQVPAHLGLEFRVVLEKPKPLQGFGLGVFIHWLSYTGLHVGSCSRQLHQGAYRLCPESSHNSLSL